MNEMGYGPCCGVVVLDIVWLVDLKLASWIREEDSINISGRLHVIWVE